MFSKNLYVGSVAFSVVALVVPGTVPSGFALHSCNDAREFESNVGFNIVGPGESHWRRWPGGNGRAFVFPLTGDADLFVYGACDAAPECASRASQVFPDTCTVQFGSLVEIRHFAFGGAPVVYAFAVIQ